MWDIIYDSNSKPFFFAYLQMKFVFNFAPTKLLLYKSSYAQSIIFVIYIQNSMLISNNLIL
jgi:hypothetical protein